MPSSSLVVSGRVNFAGLLAERQPLDEFGQAEIRAFPSHPDIAPMLNQLAMAAGMPVIATAVGGIPHQIRHNVTAPMFEAGDVDAPSRHIARVGCDAMLSVHRFAFGIERVYET